MEIWLIKFIFTFLLCILGIVFPKSKLMFIINTIVIILLCGGYNGRFDIPGYTQRYEMGYISQNISERIYDILALQFRNMGFEFQIFHMFITVICILIIAYVIIRMTKNISYVMSAMMGFGTLEYGIQIQSMCATAIVVYAVYYLFTRKNDKNYLKVTTIYILLIVLACGFHFMAIFFLLMLIVPYIKKQKLKHYIFVELIFVIIFFPFLDKIISYSSTISVYLENYRSPILMIGMIIWQLVGIFIIQKINFNASKDNRITTSDKNLVYMIYSSSLVLILICPFYILTTQVNRIVRTWWVFYLLSSSKLQLSRRTLNMNALSLILYSFGTFILFYLVLPHSINNGVLKDIFINNIFF